MDKASVTTYVLLAMLTGIVIYHAYAQAHQLDYKTEQWIIDLLTEAIRWTIGIQILRTGGGAIVQAVKKKSDD